ncbi:hypothetical protein G4B88_007331 [Cannabis sativa]|uniref:DAGKc domain-containing protein n=1 Tax=Cannabis sativa TaxID=3483 RepID=A0A7J6F7X8_CANSA|nr:hypothetical protein G4B88_007331 [Cannabis sativa]
MQSSGSGSRNSNLPSLRVTVPQQSLRRLGLCSQIATAAGGQHSSPIVFPEKQKRSRVKSSRRGGDATAPTPTDDPEKLNTFEHRIDIGGGPGAGGGDEKSNLLGYEVFSGKLILDKRKPVNVDATSSEAQTQSSSSDISNQEAVNARLTSKALIWGSHKLALEDVISISYNVGLRHFTVHSYPFKKGACGFSCFMKPRRARKDFRFLASSVDEAVQWVGGFADQQCYVKCLPHPLLSSKKQASSELIPIDTPTELIFKCKSPPKMLVILNPRSGRGRSSKVFHKIVEPIFKLAGFKLEVVKTTSAGHARTLASTVDISRCPDGIICVGGDGIINEVLNGLLSRDNQKEGISIPIGIIPAGSDNSLVWTVLGVRDPISAAMAIVKGGLTATDVFAVEWIQTGVIHFGMTVSYYGFVSDVLELSEKYQKRFGPLRYFVAGFLKFLCLPKYSYELSFLPATTEDQEGKMSAEREVVDMSDLYTDIMRRPNTDGIPRASSLSSIDSIMTPSRISGDLDTTCSSTHASAEPSEYVRGLDPKSKRLSTGRSNINSEPEVIHPQNPLSTTPNWPRTRSKSKTDKSWTGLTATHDTSRCSWGNVATHDKEDISSTLSDPGPIWDAEPKWDSEATWDVENPIELPGPPEDVEAGTKKEVSISRYDDKWVVKKGQFLGILVCNHACRTVQSSQVVAPKAEYDDNTLDMILVHGSGRWRLIRFFVLLQMGKHLSLPYVEYVKLKLAESDKVVTTLILWYGVGRVKSVKIKASGKTHNSCGIDGELFPLNGQVVSLLPEQCRLIGRSFNHHV